MIEEKVIEFTLEIPQIPAQINLKVKSISD